MQRRTEIIDAAKKVFSAKGFSSAKIEKIAVEAQLSPGTIYLYFKSKKDLYVSILIETLKYLVNKVDEIVKMIIPIEAKIKKTSNAFVEAYDHDSQNFINLLLLQSDHPLNGLSDEVLEELKENSLRLYRVIADMIEEGIEQEIFINENPLVLADLFWTTYSGIVLCPLALYETDVQKNKSVKRALCTAFTIINRGIQPRIV